jgi:hypothetical protein
MKPLGAAVSRDTMSSKINDKKYTLDCSLYERNYDSGYLS